MGRDTNGDYSLPAGNPVTSGTTIQSSWANSTLSDLADSMTDSLDRQGRGGMLAPFKFADGTEAEPSITWSNDQNTGLYHPSGSTGEMRLSVSASDLMRWDNTKVYIKADGVWNEVVYAGGPGGMPDGNANYQSIVWNSTNSAWESTSSLLINYDTGNVTIAAGLAVGNDITLSGTVDGRDVSNDGDKLDFHVDNSPLIHFDDVNNDGIQYARKDRAWVEVAASGAVVPDGTAEGQTLRWDTAGGWQNVSSILIDDSGDVSMSGTLTAAILSVTGNTTLATATVTSTLGVTGLTSLTTMNTTGNVGIGKTNPASILDVEGKIFTEGEELVANAKRFSVLATLPGTTDANTIYFLTG